MGFLSDVFAVLRPGGLFLLREHDCSSLALQAMCDAAHWVFNAGTGVQPDGEKGEIRAFRPILGIFL